ncbi:MAG: hypothetical protein LBF61_02275 [Azoarcus sp.]|jgi:hypothetical protein|nr:hypothetical protein [Azoarcus sp.]
MRKKTYHLPLPDYAVDLLMAAKHSIHNNCYTHSLLKAVEAFEENMPLTPDGDIAQVSGRRDFRAFSSESREAGGDD